jgi:hypothetical protein
VDTHSGRSEPSSFISLIAEGIPYANKLAESRHQKGVSDQLHNLAAFPHGKRSPTRRLQDGVARSCDSGE